MKKLFSSLAALLVLSTASAQVENKVDPNKAPGVPTEVKPDVTKASNLPALEGHPVTSVVVTQCNLIVAVYMTMQDGRLLRFDTSSRIPADQLLEMAYAANRSERVEVSCNDNSGAVGYEKHDPV